MRKRITCKVDKHKVFISFADKTLKAAIPNEITGRGRSELDTSGLVKKATHLCPSSKAASVLSGAFKRDVSTTKDFRKHAHGRLPGFHHPRL